MISEGTAESALLFDYSNPLVRFCDRECIDFLGFGCLELRLDFKIEQFQELTVYLGVEPKCPQQRSFWSLFRVFFRSDPLHSRTECEFLKITLVKHMVFEAKWGPEPILGDAGLKCNKMY